LSRGGEQLRRASKKRSSASLPPQYYAAIHGGSFAAGGRVRPRGAPGSARHLRRLAWLGAASRPVVVSPSWRINSGSIVPRLRSFAAPSMAPLRLEPPQVSKTNPPWERAEHRTPVARPAAVRAESSAGFVPAKTPRANRGAAPPSPAAAGAVAMRRRAVDGGATSLADQTHRRSRFAADPPRFENGLLPPRPSTKKRAPNPLDEDSTPSHLPHTAQAKSNAPRRDLATLIFRRRSSAASGRSPPAAKRNRRPDLLARPSPIIFFSGGRSGPEGLSRQKKSHGAGAAGQFVLQWSSRRHDAGETFGHDGRENNAAESNFRLDSINVTNKFQRRHGRRRKRAQPEQDAPGADRPRWPDSARRRSRGKPAMPAPRTG